jgi:hypothetical protein
MALKQRVLAEWKLPPTDRRLGKMNTARWVMAHQMILELERRMVRRWARFLGTDASVVGQEEVPEAEFGDVTKVVPLAALLNPEVYKRFVEADPGSSIEDSIPDDRYEAQIAALDQAGMLSDIDMLGEEVEKAIKKKKSDRLDELFPMTDD